MMDSPNFLTLTIFGVILAATTYFAWYYLARDEEEGDQSRGRLQRHGQQSEAKTHQDLLEHLITFKLIRTDVAKRAYGKVDRGFYVDYELCKSILGEKFSPYADNALPLPGNSTISAPHMHALGLDLLCEVLKPGDSVLDVGSGSGFMTACLAEVVGPQGKVHGIEHLPELVELGKKNVSTGNPDLLNRIKFHQGDGLEGVPEGAPFKTIYVGAAAESLESAQKLINQLEPGGRMVIPVGANQGFHKFLQVDVTLNGNVKVKSHGIVRFVPLSDPKKQRNADVTNGVTHKLTSATGKDLLVKTYVVPAPDSTIEDYRALRYEMQTQRSRAQNSD